LTLDPKGGLLEPLPDLGSLSDDDLKKLIDDLTQQENEISYQRRLLHGKIDILRAERGLRADRRVKGGDPTHVEVAGLQDILAANLLWKRPKDRG
jgi:anti-sigma-K factor RsiG